MAVKIKSPVTGMVWKILATAGQTLDEGADLVVLESMKMEIPVTMPRAGRVLGISVKEGQAIAEGQTLAEIE
jgi:acetyl-CoA carboxylase biotin carboxyl carrier protein